MSNSKNNSFDDQNDNFNNDQNSNNDSNMDNDLDINSYINPVQPPKSAAVSAYLTDKYYDQLVWDDNLSSWLFYESDTGIWKKLTDTKVKSLVQQELDTREDTKNNYNSGYIADIINLLKGKLVTESKWNHQNDLLPLRNGVLNLSTNKLLKHSPDYKFTYYLPYDYDPYATCEPIQRWMLETVQGDKKVVQLLRAYMKAVVTGRSDLQKFLECVGPGGTGKSTFANLVIALIGVKNVQSTKLSLLGKNQFEPANLMHKKLVYLADAEKYNGDASVLKALTGGDPLRMERKFQQESESSRYKGLVLIVTNDTIQFKDANSGIQRRRITVPFNHQVRSENRRNLIEIDEDRVTGDFAEYLPGLLNWVLDMPDDDVKELLVNTHRSVPSLGSAKADTLLETNPMASWLDECVVLAPDMKTHVGSQKQSPTTHLYPNYVVYCKDHGHRSVSCTRFSKDLLDLVNNQLSLCEIKKIKDRQGNYILDLRLRTEADIAPRPITEVMDDISKSDVSVKAQSPVNTRRDECDGFKEKLSA